MSVETTGLQFHLGCARQDGVTEEEWKEAILHLAFYTGWPNGIGAMTALKDIVKSQDSGGAVP